MPAWQLGRAEAYGVTLQGVAPRDLARPKGLVVTSRKIHKIKLLAKNIFQNIFIAELESFPAIRRPDTKNQISVPTPKSNIA